ncbi:MAG: hypothetical protein KatS3mg055_3285 [Chloroflexus sp.]|nr:MAG: hypothetical protein KatS3mg055_3285 [Chloroflexus sp.]
MKLIWRVILLRTLVLLDGRQQGVCAGARVRLA